MGKRGFARTGVRRCVSALLSSVAFGIAALPAIASATLSVTPLTWNVVGLDSNAPASGPQNFPVGARICSTAATGNIAANLVWDSANPYIATRPGSQSSLAIPAIAANACADAYFEAQVTRDAAAFDTTRRYHISATDGVDAAATSTPRELYVEHLISQNRNSITGIKVDGVAIPAGGSVGLVVGNTYVVELDAGTATQGYSQFEAFINFSNAIFQIQSVATTYSADNSPFVPGPAPAISDKLYADACEWENNPASPNYRSCIGGDYKAGGNTIKTLYTIRIISGGGSSQALSTLLYDFSGSSFHYNADFGVHGIIANIIDPAALGFVQQFMPSSTTPGGTSTLTFTLTNPNAAPVSGAGFSDNLPNLAGGQMVIASPATFSTIGCGAPTFAPVAGASTLSVTNATIPANGTCTMSVLVSVPGAPSSGTYVNTSGNLVVDAIDTGRNTTANLGLSASVPPTNVCGLTLANWSMAPGSTTVPPAATGKAGDVALASASAGAGISTTIDTGIGNPVNAWAANGFDTGTTLSLANDDYFEFAVDTSKYTAITFAFDARLANQTHGPQSLQLFMSTDGTTYAPYGPVLAATSTFQTFNPALASAANASGTTWFRIYGWNSANSGNSALIYIDNITIGGCATARPATLSKTFTPSTVVVGGTSTLQFTLTNPNTVALTGAGFSDSLPPGMQVASTPAATNTCSGAPTWAPAAGATNLAFGQSTGATIPASASCTVSVNVTVTTPGTHSNVSGFIASVEGGTNATPAGSASATLQALVAPSIAAAFAPAAVQINANAVLTFTITNPNASVALSGVAFTDNYPANLVNANPAVPAVTNTCSGALTASPGGSGVSLAAGAIPAAGSCTISVPVTSAVAGNYATTTGPVSDAAAGSGNTASAMLGVTAPAPASSVLKQIGTSATGPWFSFVAVAPGTPLFYRFTVENTGDVALNPFAVSDATLTAAGANPANCAWQTSNVPTTLPALPVASATLDPTATCVIGPVLAALGAGSNTATAQGTFGGTVYASTASTADYIGAVPGFSLVKEAATSPLGPWSSAIGVAAGADVFYRFTLVNTGALDLTGITVSDAMVDVSSCSFTNPLVVGDATTCTVGPVTAIGVAGNTITNTATGHGVNGGSTIDTAPSSASYTISNANADLAIGNGNGVSGLSAGGNATYTVTVSNNGPDGVTDATVIDSAPPGLAFGAWTCAVTNAGTGGSVVTACGTSGGSGNVNTSVTLQPGAVITYTLAANIDSAASGSITSTASVAAPVGVFDAVGANDSATDTDPVDVVADLSVAIDDGVASVLSGAATVYSVTVTNSGPASSVGAALTDPAVAGLSKSAITCSATPGQCVAPPTIAALESGGFALPLLAPGATYQIQVGAQVTAGNGTVTNGATITSAAGSSDPNSANNDASDTDTVIPAPINADLAVTLTDGTSSVTAGTPVTYTITVANNGSSTIGGATLGDPVVPGLVKTAVACAGIPGQCVTPPTIAELDSGTFALPVLAPGATYALAVTAAVTATSATVANTAMIAMPVGIVDDIPANNSATDVDNVLSLPPGTVDVSVNVDDGVVSVTAGALVTYTITITNDGPLDAVAVAVNDAFPVTLGGVTWNCVGFLGGICPEAPGTGDILTTVNVPVGALVVFTATGTLSPAATGALANSATVLAAPPAVDRDTGNDSFTDTDTILPAVVQTDLAVSIDDGTGTVAAGTTTNYTVTVVNNGPSAVAGAILADPAVVGLAKTAVACAPAPGACVTPPTLTALESGSFVLPPLASGGAWSVIVTATVTAASGSVKNVATVAAPAGVIDGVAANNSASDTDVVTLVPPPAVVTDLAISAIANPGTVPSGDSFTYTLIVTNNGPTGIANAVVTDLAPAGITFGTWTCGVTNAGTGNDVTTACGAAIGTGDVNATATLRRGAIVTYVIAATTAPGMSGNVVNAASVNVPTDATDPSPGNNTASATIQMQATPVVATAQPIPTLSEWALIALALLISNAAARGMRPRARRE